MIQRLSETSVVFDEAHLANPYPLYHELRAAEPIFWDPALSAWVLTRYEDVASALRDQRLGSERLGSLEALQNQGLSEAVPIFRIISDMMLFNDPPRHTRMRVPVAAVLTPRMVLDLGGFVEDIVETLLQRIQTWPILCLRP